MNNKSVRIEVLVLVAGTIREVVRWRLQPNHLGQTRAVYADSSDRPPDEAWDAMALEIVRRALPTSDDCGRAVEIFLYLQDDLFTSIYNYGDFNRIVTDARRHAWGSRIYVAWDRSPLTAFTNLNTDISAAVIEVWLRSLRDADVAGLLEVRRAQATLNDDAETIRLLRGYTAEYAKRKALLQSLGAGGGWGMSHRKHARSLADLLRLFVKGTLLPADSPNRIIFFDRKLTLALKKELLDKRPPGNYVVATTQETFSGDLESACAEEDPPLQLIQFSGHFEAIYSLLQLNRVAGEKR